MSKLVILGRDGVINEHPGYTIGHPDRWEPIPGSLEAIARLNQAGWRVAVATNQPGLARGELDLDTLNAVHHKLHDRLDRLGGQLAAIAFCPHGPDAGCDCRKPATGMYRQLAERFGAAVKDVTVIGAGVADMQAAQAIGARVLLVSTGPGGAADVDASIPLFDNLAQAVNALLVEEN